MEVHRVPIIKNEHIPYPLGLGMPQEIEFFCVEVLAPKTRHHVPLFGVPLGFHVT